jgi:hypothetical protein
METHSFAAYRLKGTLRHLSNDCGNSRREFATRFTPLGFFNSRLATMAEWASMSLTIFGTCGRNTLTAEPT